MQEEEKEELLKKSREVQKLARRMRNLMLIDPEDKEMGFFSKKEVANIKVRVAKLSARQWQELFREIGQEQTYVDRDQLCRHTLLGRLEQACLMKASGQTAQVDFEDPDFEKIFGDFKKAIETGDQNEIWSSLQEMIHLGNEQNKWVDWPQYPTCCF